MFTDIEGSTQLQRRLGDDYQSVVENHRLLLEKAIDAAGRSSTAKPSPSSPLATRPGRTYVSEELRLLRLPAAYSSMD